jgi:tRNA threonylcarbamoyl adenosine modification protein (Sua5/YciO/YrdC/YwlC family)
MTASFDRRDLASMTILSINPDNPQQRLLDKVTTLLRQGGIICYPTDTMYGIGCDIFNQKAVNRVFQIKKRPKHKPFSFMCSSLKDLSTYCHMPNMAYKIMRKHLPGPYTFILPAMKIVPKILITKQKTVGIRVPDNAICQQLVQGLGNPILTSSATIGPDQEAPAEAYQVEELFGTQVDLVIDSGPVFPQPSTVISMVGEEYEILRVGKGPIDIF